MRTLNDYFLTVKLADISSASSAFVAFDKDFAYLEIGWIYHLLS